MLVASEGKRMDRERLASAKRCLGVKVFKIITWIYLHDTVSFGMAEGARVT